MMLYCGMLFFKQKTSYDMRISDWSSDVCSSDLADTDAAVRHSRRLIDEGVHILDLVAGSTRPGAEPVPAPDELARLLPVIESLRDCGVPLSIDTFKPDVMRAVLDEIGRAHV